MNTECKIKDCHLCKEQCPQAETANKIALGRMYATKELIKLQKELEEYQKLGTVEELRVAAERMKPMAPDIGIDNGSKRRCCGNCGFFYEPTSHFCSWCGQNIKIK